MSKLISTGELHNVVMKRKGEYGRLAWLIENIVKEMVYETHTVEAIIIPKEATNGDMIKAMFPNAEYREDTLGNVFIISSAQLGCIAFRESWWNAPYKGEYNLSEKPTGSESEDME